MFSLTDLDALIAARSLLKHPFYQRWSRGQLTQGDLQTYVKEYFHLVQRVPSFVTSIRDRITDQKKRAEVEQNRVEEQEHIALWEDFAESLGVTREELSAYVPSRKTQEAMLEMDRLSRESEESGVAAMYALERELPEIAQTKKDGLCRFYNLTSSRAHRYFDEHLKEAKHLHVWQSFTITAEKAIPAAEGSMDAQNKVLDAVCEIRGISMDC